VSVHTAWVKLLDSYGLVPRSLYEVLGGHTLNVGTHRFVFRRWAEV